MTEDLAAAIMLLVFKSKLAQFYAKSYALSSILRNA